MDRRKFLKIAGGCAGVAMVPFPLNYLISKEDPVTGENIIEQQIFADFSGEDVWLRFSYVPVKLYNKVATWEQATIKYRVPEDNWIRISVPHKCYYSDIDISFDGNFHQYDDEEEASLLRAMRDSKKPDVRRYTSKKSRRKAMRREMARAEYKRRASLKNV